MELKPSVPISALNFIKPLIVPYGIETWKSEHNLRIE